MGALRIEAAIGPDGVLPLTGEQCVALGGGSRIPVSGTVNGMPFRTTTFQMSELAGLVFPADLLARAGIRPGATAVVEVAPDAGAHDPNLPPALAAALAADPEARQAFDALSYAYRRRYADWVGSARLGRTRAVRVARAVALLRAVRRATKG